jgi:N-carbamoyl-D-amino-acid hydrolase
MPRIVTVGAAQMGPIALSESRSDVVQRLIMLLRQGHEAGCDLVVFTEVALTTFFAHFWIEGDEELDRWFEQEMPSAETRPLFAEAVRLQVAFCLGYAELDDSTGERRRFNSSILVDRRGQLVGKYRKVHLPGCAELRTDHPFQNLEKKYFEVGNLGFPVWRTLGGIVGMLICNDRRWPEAYRMLGLQGVELVLIGYNTPALNPDFSEFESLSPFHNQLSMQAGAYQNGTWVVGVAKAGVEEGVRQIGQSMIISPTGEIVAQASTLGDELITYRCDLDLAQRCKKATLNFERNRRTEYYGLITSQTGVVEPE